MLRRVATAFLLIAWLCANGAHLDVLQVAAWGKMFAGYSGTMSVSQALRETFDPAKPCEMCVGIAKAKDETEKQMPAKEQRSSEKFVLAVHVVSEPVFVIPLSDWTAGQLLATALRTDPVPVPPPRV